jgi:hypothetical protein
MIFKEDEIIQLCTVDAEIITKALSVSKNLGIAAIKDSIGNYTGLIKSHKGTFIPSMDLDYRTYIINLLKLATESASEENKSIIFSEIIIPS